MQENISKLELQKDNLQKEEQILSAELSDRERLLNESIKLHAKETQQLQTQITTQEQNINDLKDIIQDLMQSSLKDSVSTEQMAELERSRATITDLESELQFTNDALAIRDKLLAEGDKTQDIIQNLQATISTLETTPNMTKEQFDKLTELQNKIRVLETNLNISARNLEGEEKQRLEEGEQAEKHIETQQEIIKKLLETISILEKNPTMTPEQLKEIDSLRNTTKS